MTRTINQRLPNIQERGQIAAVAVLAATINLLGFVPTTEEQIEFVRKSALDVIARLSRDIVAGLPTNKHTERTSSRFRTSAENEVDSLLSRMVRQNSSLQ